MAEQEERQSHFPPEFDYLEKELANVEQQLSDIDGKIEALPNNNGPRLTFQPPGAPPITHGGDYQKAQLGQQRAELISGFQGYSKNELNKTDPKTAGKLNDYIDHRLSDNEFRNKSREELTQEKGDVKPQEKSFEPGGKSFDYMEANYFNKYQPPSNPNEPQKENFALSDKSNIDSSQLWLDKIDAQKQQSAQAMELPEKSEFDKSEPTPEPDIEPDKD